MTDKRENRIMITLTKEAKAIYDSITGHGKSKYVNQAIIEKKSRENNSSISDQIKSAIEEHIKIYHRKDD